MQLAWSSLGIAVSDFGGAGGAAAALRVDPVDALRLGAGPLRRLRSSSARRQRLSPPPPRRLAGGGAFSSASGAVAACAIATTILGTGRALATWCQDALAHQAHVAARAAAWSFRTLFELAYRSRTRPALLPPIKALSAGRHFLDTSYALPRHFLDAYRSRLLSAGRLVAPLPASAPWRRTAFAAPSRSLLLRAPPPPPPFSAQSTSPARTRWRFSGACFRR